MTKRIGDIIVEQGSAERAEVESAALVGQSTGTRIGEVLVNQGILDDKDIYQAVALRHGLVFADAEALFGMLDPRIARRLPRRFQEHEQVVPICQIDDTIVVAACDAAVHTAELASAAGVKFVDIRIVTPTDHHRLRTAVDLGQIEMRAGPRASTVSRRARDLMSTRTEVNAELISLFDAVLLDAIVQRASDIHLEIYGERVRVRLRIDGDLHDVQRYQLSREQLLGVMNVVKVNADLDIAERRLPQGGRITTRTGGQVFDLRVQTQPSLHGEHVVIRLLPQDQKILGVEDLGFSSALADAYRRLLSSPQGLVLVVGPTGSGKSTTLYAGLMVLGGDPSRKVITVEDPIEYAMNGVQQTQARPDIGFGFADAMRSFVRQDPDVILIGEIRDQETALEAIRASQTGHLVLSTLHCNDAVDVVQRLRDLGMQPNSIASELIAVFAQRLAKRICTNCRVPAEADPALFAEVFPHGAPAGFASFKGKGCGRCNHLGTHGRIAVIEYLPTGAAMRRAIARDLPVDDLRAAARIAGLVAMRDQALDLVTSGIIPFEELMWVLPAESLAGE
jgi:type IV pilus assembly protein PilB